MQGKVNVNTGQSIGAIQKAITSATAGLGDAVKEFSANQKMKRAKTEAVIQNANKNRNQLVSDFTSKTNTSSSVLNGAFTSHIRKTADYLKSLEVRAMSPGASEEDMAAYNEAYDRAYQELNMLGEYAVLSKSKLTTYAGDTKAREQNGYMGRLTNSGLDEYSDDIKFDAPLVSGGASSAEIVYVNGRPMLSYSYMNTSISPAQETKVDKPHDIIAEVQTFKATGEQLADRAIGEKDLLLNKYIEGAEAKKQMQEWTKQGGILHRAKRVERVWNGREYITTSTLSEVDAADAVLGDAATRLQIKNSTTLPGFDKTWTQLTGDGYVDEKYKDLAWNTFGTAYSDDYLERLNKNYDAIKALDPTTETDAKGPRITKEDYLQIQRDIRGEAVNGVARVYGRFASHSEQVIAENIQEVKPGSQQEAKYMKDAKALSEHNKRIIAINDHVFDPNATFKQKKDKNGKMITISGNLATQIAQQLKTGQYPVGIKNQEDIFSGEELLAKQITVPYTDQDTGEVEDKLLTVAEHIKNGKLQDLNISTNMVYSVPGQTAGDFTKVNPLYDASGVDLEQDGTINAIGRNRLYGGYGMNEFQANYWRGQNKF